VLEGNLHSTHGADVETEKTTSNDGDGRDKVDIAVLLHHCGQSLCVVKCKCVTGSRDVGRAGSKDESEVDSMVAVAEELCTSGCELRGVETGERRTGGGCRVVGGSFMLVTGRSCRWKKSSYGHATALLPFARDAVSTKPINAICSDCTYST